MRGDQLDVDALVVHVSTRDVATRGGRYRLAFNHANGGGAYARTDAATSLLDVSVNGARQGDFAQAALASSTRFIELDAATWSNNTVRVMARNISPTATFDLSAATLSVGLAKRRIP